MSPLARKIGRFIIADIVLIVALIAFGMGLTLLRIPVNGHEALADLFGQHGILFGMILPVLIYLLIPAIAIWIVALVIAAFRQNR